MSMYRLLPFYKGTMVDEHWLNEAPMVDEHWLNEIQSCLMSIEYSIEFSQYKFIVSLFLLLLIITIITLNSAVTR